MAVMLTEKILIWPLEIVREVINEIEFILFGNICISKTFIFLYEANREHVS